MRKFKNSILIAFICIVSSAFACAFENSDSKIVSDVEHSKCHVLSLKELPNYKDRLGKVMQRAMRPSSGMSLFPKKRRYNSSNYKPVVNKTYKFNENNLLKLQYTYMSDNVKGNEIRREVLSNELDNTNTLY